MSITFPTSNALKNGSAQASATPTRAEPCRCGRGALIDTSTDLCIRCGKYPAVTIDRTWHRRAKALGLRQP